MNANENGNGNLNGNDNGTGPPQFVICRSTGGEDQDINFDDFGEFGTTRVVAGTIGEGRHLVVSEGRLLEFRLDQPVRFCAVTPDNITMRDLTTEQDIPLTQDQLQRVNLVDGTGRIVAARIVITLPAEVVVGHDYEVTLDSETIGLDGEFQENAGTTMASNGTLPSGDGNPGGDFVQIFRAISRINYLTDTRQSAGMALDATDNLYLVSENGLFGPFDAPKAVVDGDQLASNLPSLAKRTIVVDNDGKIIVKGGSADGLIFEVDPATGVSTQIAQADDLTSHPNDSIVAPSGYASIERSAVEPGDVLFADTAQISVLDRRAAAGQKGGLDLVERPSGNISDAYVSLFVPPARGDEERLVYGAFTPEEGTALELHRILPNGVVDKSAWTNPSSLPEVAGTAVLKLDDIQGREEYLIIGRVDTALRDLKQILTDDFDGVSVMIYNATEDRLQVLFPLSLDLFNFSSFGLFSDIVLTSDLNTVYVSLPSASAVAQFAGFANGAASAGEPACDPSFDNAIGVPLASGTARVFRSTLGNGRHLLRSTPTVLEFDIDQPVPLCAVNADNIRLRDLGTGQDISLATRRIKRWLFSDAAGSVTLGSRIIIDLPASLVTGSFYELTLDAAALGLDGEFASAGLNGLLPSGDGTPGGDYVHIFQLIEGDYFVTETGGAAGVDLDGTDALYTATATNILGPFTAPGTPGPATTLSVGSGQEISGQELTKAGKPMAANDDSSAAAITYASLRDSKLYDADPVTGIAEIFQTDFGQSGPGSFEVDMIEAPASFAGDYLHINTQRGVLIDVAASTTVSLFTSSSQLFEFKSLSVPPADLFGELVYVAASDRSAGSFSMIQIEPDGTPTDVFTPLAGATGEAGIRLQDYLGDAEYLILGDFDPAGAQLRTGAIRTADEGTELILYNPAQNRLQVIGTLSQGADMTFTQNLETLYTTQPVLRAVLRFQGMGASQP